MGLIWEHESQRVLGDEHGDSQLRRSSTLISGRLQPTGLPTKQRAWITVFEPQHPPGLSFSEPPSLPTPAPSLHWDTSLVSLVGVAPTFPKLLSECEN